MKKCFFHDSCTVNDSGTHHSKNDHVKYVETVRKESHIISHFI